MSILIWVNEVMRSGRPTRRFNDSFTSLDLNTHSTWLESYKFDSSQNFISVTACNRHGSVLIRVYRRPPQ